MVGNSNGTRSLAGQRALVTGASSDLGAEIAQALAAAGAAVAINSVCRPEEAERVVRKITAEGGEAIAVAADVSREDGVKALFQRVSEVYGSIDILVNNADLQKHAPLVNMTLEDWEEVLRVNLTGQFLCAREAAGERDLPGCGQDGGHPDDLGEPRTGSRAPRAHSLRSLGAGRRHRPRCRLASLGCLGLHDRDDALCRRGYEFVSPFRRWDLTNRTLSIDL
jgi:short chain dehydrogenase